MAELVNLRTARKRAQRRRDEARADANRLSHAQPKRLRKLKTAQQEKTNRDLDRHRIETGNDR
jgi:hypothetical protein